jgi:anti-anti-sigma factor
MPDGDGAAGQGMLTARVAAGESGPVIVLSGEADLTTVAQLSALITAQLARGTRQLTIDVSELWFADSATRRTLVLAARTLRERGGSLVLLRPRRPVARVQAHKGALEEGGELRLVIPAGGDVIRILTFTSLHRFIPLRQPARGPPPETRCPVPAIAYASVIWAR